MEDQVQDMLAKGIIEESNSTWNPPAILVPKKSFWAGSPGTDFV
jgi:hypothetical protein